MALLVSSGEGPLAGAPLPSPRKAVGQKAPGAGGVSEDRAFYAHGWLDRHPGVGLPIKARSALLVDLGTRQELWARNPAQRMAPASLAKMMTAEVALRHAGIGTVITVPDGATHLPADAIAMGLSPGERLTVGELLDGVFVISANDAAEALAQGIIPRDEFVAEMNRLARSWGLEDSAFSNPTGLDDAGLYSSSYDLATIAGHLVADHPAVLQIASAAQIVLPASPAHKEYELDSVNGLIVHNYPGATGLKTGLTDAAGYCIAGTATRGDRHLLVVVLDSETDLDDARALLDYGFSTASGRVPGDTRGGRAS